MTITTLHADVAVLSLDDRAAALIRLAELDLLRDFPAGALMAAIRTYASGSIADHEMRARFEALKDAVRAQQRYATYPESVLSDADLPNNETGWAAMDDRLAGDLDVAVYELLNPSPPCKTCRRGRVRSQWKPALWPMSLYCADHRQVSA